MFAFNLILLSNLSFDPALIDRLSLQEPARFIEIADSNQSRWKRLKNKLNLKKRRDKRRKQKEEKQREKQMTSTTTDEYDQIKSPKNMDKLQDNQAAGRDFKAQVLAEVKQQGLKLTDQEQKMLQPNNYKKIRVDGVRQFTHTDGNKSMKDQLQINNMAEALKPSFEEQLNEKLKPKNSNPKQREKLREDYTNIKNAKEAGVDVKQMTNYAGQIEKQKVDINEFDEGPNRLNKYSKHKEATRNEISKGISKIKFIEKSQQPKVAAQNVNQKDSTKAFMEKNPAPSRPNNWQGEVAQQAAQ
jgi:hypothetical protein